MSGTPSLAHAQLLVASPGISQTLASSPGKVTLTFDDSLIDLAGGNQILVTNSDGQQVQTGPSLLSGAQLSVLLKPSLSDGKYQVIYKVISNDGHPVASSYFFYVTKTKIKSAKTIECVNGKITKRVTSSNPKCPSGFRKK
jgi:copper resistance protein C